MTTQTTADKSPGAHPNDFAAFFLQDTSTVFIKLPNGQPMVYGGQPVSVVVYGPSTERYVTARDARDREATKALMNIVDSSKAEADKEADARFLSAVTERIDHFPFPGGPAAVYREPRLRYVADQVRAHLADLGNFFKGSTPA